MNKFLLILSIICLNELCAQWSINATIMTINFNGVKTEYVISESGVAMEYDGAILGNFTSNIQSFSIDSWYVFTQSNVYDGCIGAALFYLLYEDGNRPASPTFNQLDGEILNTYAAEQLWGQRTSTNIDISTLNADKTYNLEIFIIGTGLPSIIRNNSGDNYIASFSTISTFPVELVCFTAATSSNGIALSWQTATEVNNYGFDIERGINKITSSDTEWEKIGFVEGHGNSNSLKHYEYIDEDVPTMKLEYRLKQIDTDGAFEYSHITVKIDARSITDVKENRFPTEFSLKQNYPNPFNPTTNIEFSIPSDNYVEIKVYNVLGMEVATLSNEQRQAGTYSAEFNASNLVSGIYFYKIISGNYSEIKKMILLR